MSQAPFWLRWLPAALRAKIEHRPNLQKILGNTGWLFADKILRMGMGLLVGVWVARYLGPEQFGLFNYVTAIVALFTAIATLGLNNIVVRDLVKHPEDADATLGTACLLQLIGGVLATGAAVVAVSVMRPDDATARLMVAIVGSAMVFKASDVIRYWFEARVQSKYTVWVENAAFLIFAAIKVWLILAAAPLLAFVWIVLAEAALVAALLLLIYTQQGNRLGAWRCHYARAKTLLHDSWPLILSGLAAMLYMRIDQIMLGQMLGNEAVGIYSAAVRISEVWYFIPTMITASVFPSIIKARSENQKIYYQRIQKLLELMMVLALSLAIPISLTADWIMTILYGEGYSESAQILIIHIWTGIFVFSGVAGGRWFIAENLQKYTLYRTLAGGAVNLSLNYLLIPQYGPIGSAWASVISQATASVFFNALNRSTHRLFIMQIKSITGANIFTKNPR
ncbi:flippase [Malikia spinosa]|uniref:flippase n=1 Tax=Malikia spinosa TaxID=86180 RepID=UPI003FA202F5